MLCHLAFHSKYDNKPVYFVHGQGFITKDNRLASLIEVNFALGIIEAYRILTPYNDGYSIKGI